MSRPSGRRWLWGAVIVVVAAASLPFAGWLLLEILSVSNAQPNPTIDSREALSQLAARHAGVSLDEGEGAWFLLEELLEGADEVRREIDDLYAAGAFPPRDEYDTQLDYARAQEGRSLPADLGPERRALALLAERGVLDAWDRFAAGPAAFRPLAGDGPLDFRDLTVDLSSCRMLAQAGAAMMRLSVNAGDGRSAARAFDRVLAIARTIAVQRTMINDLTATAIGALALQELRFGLMEHEVDQESCAAFLEVLSRHGSPPPASALLDGERVFFEDLVQWSYSDDGAGDGYLLQPWEDGVASQERVGFFGAVRSRFWSRSRRELMEEYDTLMDRLGEVASLAPGERAAAAARLRSTVDVELGEQLPEAGFPVLLDILSREVVGLLRLEGTRVMVAVELYERRHGRLPASLDDLAPGILPSPPRDPLGGQPFGYRLLEGDPGGRRYLLYSRGLDRADDAGADPSKAMVTRHRWDEVLTKPGTRGDLVINRPRIEH